MEEHEVVDPMPTVQVEWICSSVVRMVVVGAWAALSSIGDHDPGGFDAEP